MSSERKHGLRASLRQAAEQLPAEVHRRESAAVCRRLLSLAVVRKAHVIAAFWPRRGEVDLRAFIEAGQAEGKLIALPVVLSFSREPSQKPRMSFAVFEGPDRLTENRWGIAEPSPPRRTVPASAFDVIVVPSVALDRSGNRLGNGYGYYDELLSGYGSSRPCIVAPCLNHQLVDAVPTTDGDVRVDVLITPNETLQPASLSRPDPQNP